jgi:putative redox protein
MGCNDAEFARMAMEEMSNKDRLIRGGEGHCTWLPSQLKAHSGDWQLSETKVRYEGSLRCSAEHAESGVVVVTDAPKDNHGNGMSFSPSDLLSVSLGSCILSIMGIMARSLDIDITGATASVEKEMANVPRRIVRISVQVRVPGIFDEGRRRKLEAAAHACPVHNILNVEAPISFSWDRA